MMSRPDLRPLAFRPFLSSVRNGCELALARDGLGVEAVRDHDLNVGQVLSQALAERAQRDQRILVQHFTLRRVQDEVLAVGRRCLQDKRLTVRGEELRGELQVERALGVRVQLVERVLDLLRHPEVAVVAIAQVQAARLELLQRSLGFLPELGLRALVALPALVLDVHVRRVARLRRHRAFRVHHADRLEELLHCVRDLAVVLLAQARMIPVRRRDVREHRIRLARDRHVVAGAGLHHPVHRAVQLVDLDAHVVGRADVQAHRQPMHLAHEEVLEARAHQLVAAREHLRPDEPRDVVHDGPVVRLLANARANP